jgi:hypothetical protein
MYCEMGCQSTVMCDVAAVGVGGGGWRCWALATTMDDAGALDGQSDILSAATCCVSDVTSVTMYWYCAHVCTQPRLALRKFSTVWKTADSSCGDGGSLALSTGDERRELFCDRKLVGVACCCCLLLLLRQTAAAETATRAARSMRREPTRRTRRRSEVTVVGCCASVVVSLAAVMRGRTGGRRRR